MKHLPLGIQSFKQLRTGNSIYVDKTKLIYDLVKKQEGFYFLSRPRRFGKSLLLSTLKSFFEGKKELFEGLWIDEKENLTWEKYPVIMIDFNGIHHQSSERLEKSLLQKLDAIAEEYELELPFDSISGKLSNLITRLAKQHSKRVVVLIDEYDKAMVNHLGKGENELEIATQNRDILKELFGSLKEQSVSDVLRFVFLTGVSKFSRVSVFSDLNNLKDLTMSTAYCDLVGYTEEELNSSFKEYITELAEELSISIDECKQKLKLWYNGYQFTKKKKTLYNPFSILSVLDEKEFRNYWFETGTPTFLVDLIKSQRYPIPQLEKLKLGAQSLSTFEIDQLRLEALLFQTGYITIKGHENSIFDLSYPNQEVKTSFLTFLYNYLIEIPDAGRSDQFLFLHQYLKHSQLDSFIKTINNILASVPYKQITNKDEAWFHTMFYLMLSASGVDVLTEVITSKGQIDLAVFFDDQIYIIELKCNQNANKAIQQIRKQGYADRYRTLSQKISLMGINFDSKKREITDWKRENL